MDKNAIKKYAVWARRELISRVSQRAALYEITDKDYGTHLRIAFLVASCLLKRNISVRL